MSLINQMLRDLDARRGPASMTEAAALQGLGLSDERPDNQHILLQRTGWAIGLMLSGVLIQQVYQIWAKHQPVQQFVVIPEKILATPLLPEITPLHSIEDATPVVEKDQVSVAVKKNSAQLVKKPLTSTQQAQRRFNRAQGLLSNGQFRDASRDLRAALELKPDLDEARLQLAALYLQLGRADRANQLLESGYRMSPANTAITTAYVRLLAGQGAYQRALEVMQPGLQQDSVTADMLALSAALYFRIDDFETSASQYRRALAQNPAQAVWWMGLGVSLEHGNQPIKALEAFRRVNTSALNSESQSFVGGRISALSGRTEKNHGR